MKYILLTIVFIFSNTVYAGSHSNDYKFPKEDCDELFIGITGLLEEANNHWIFLKDLPENSTESLNRAEDIYWLTSLAANYTTVHEAFCNN